MTPSMVFPTFIDALIFWFLIHFDQIVNGTKFTIYCAVNKICCLL